MSYRPWKGFALIGIAIALDFALGRTGIVFISGMLAALGWASTYDAGRTHPTNEGR
jgi:hypothetical protein